MEGRPLAEIGKNILECAEKITELLAQLPTDSFVDKTVSDIQKCIKSVKEIIQISSDKNVDKADGIFKQAESALCLLEKLEKLLNENNKLSIEQSSIFKGSIEQLQELKGEYMKQLCKEISERMREQFVARKNIAAHQYVNNSEPLMLMYYMKQNLGLYPGAKENSDNRFNDMAAEMLKKMLERNKQNK